MNDLAIISVALIVGIIFVVKRKPMGAFLYEIHSEWGLAFGNKESYGFIPALIGIIWILISSSILIADIVLK